MGFVWDEIKEELFRFECDTLVSASAGTGKTAALVELYLRIAEGRTALGDGVSPYNILALTFTRKAAGEMRERLREALLAKLRETPDNPRHIQMLDRLSEAFIGTFDAFCMNLLRENHFEAGLPPDFSLLPDDEPYRLLRESTHKVMRLLLSQSHKGMLLLLGHSNFDQVAADLFNVARASEILSGPRPDFQAEKEELPIIMNSELDEFRSGVSRVSGLVAEGLKCSDNFRAGIHGLISEIESLDRPDIRPTPDTPRRTGTEFFIGPQGLHTAFNRIQHGSWPKEIKDIRKELASRLKKAQNAFERIFAIDEAEAAFDIAVLIRRDYSETKAAMGMLDFEDTLETATELLATHRDIREQWLSRFDVVLVDEFQDTNRRQLRLVNLLSRDDEFIAKGARPTRRLYVGDRKQSIYRFRGADVSVFRQIENEWKSRSDAKILHFRRNFRSDARLLQFSNALFGRLLNDGTQDYQSAYSSDDDLLPGLEFSSGAAPVELLRVAKSLSGRQEDRLRVEAEAVAARLREIVTEEGFYVGPAEEKRKAAFEDVAVLVRKGRMMPAFEQAFRRAGLPFTVVNGAGLFERSETRDLIAAARLLAEPWNTVTLLTVMRSPAVHLSDNSLFRLLRYCRKNSEKPEAVLKSPDECKRLCYGAELPAEECRRLLHFVEVYCDLSSRRRLLPASEVFEELLERLDLEAVALGDVEAARCSSNQQKLLRLLRDMEERNGSGDLNAALHSLDRLQRDGSGPGEAPSSACGIQLMTIHQSKGLEFPIVVLPALEIKPGRFAGRLLADARAGVIAKTRGAAEGDPFEERKEIHKSMELAEERRVYYVAATRAKDRLIIGTSVADGGRSDSRESDGDGGSAEKIDMAEAVESAAAVCGFDLRVTDIDGTTSFRVTPQTENNSQPAAGPNAAEMEKLCAEALSHPDGPSMLGTFSVTMLRDFQICERRYHLKRMLERSTNLWMEAPFADEDNPEGASLGLLAHRFLETIPSGSVPADGDIAGFFSDVAQYDPEGAARAVRSLKRFFASEWYADFARLASQEGVRLHREMPFIADFELSDGRHARLKGRVDLLLEPPTGDLRLIDYKYARPDTVAAADYLMQAAAYSRALQRAWPGRRILAEIVYLAGSGGVVRLDPDTPESAAALARFEHDLSEAQSRSGLPYSQWRTCSAEDCRADACRFMKLCGTDEEAAG